MKPKFLADVDLKRAIVRGVKRKEPSVDFQSAQEARLEGLEDARVLEIATERGRILVTHDFGTMPRHFKDFISGRHSPGVFLISQDLPIGQAVEVLLMIWAASDSAEWEDQLTYLPL